MPITKTNGIALAVIPAVASIIVAVIQFHPGKTNPPAIDPAIKKSLVITGTVIDESSGQGLRTADITLVGRTESYTTEETGNFRLSLPSSIGEGESVRLRVTKSDYVPADRSFSPPSEGIVIALHKQQSHQPQ